MKLRLSPSVLIIGVAAGIFIIGYWFLILPQFRKLGSALHELDASSQSLSKAANGGQSRAERAADLERLTMRAGQLLPTTDRQSDLSIQIEAAADATGVSLTGLVLNAASSLVPKTSTAQAAAGGAEEVQAAITVTGGYQQIQDFVTALTRLDRLVLIEQVNMSSTAATQGQISGQIAAKAYFLPEKAAVSSEATPAPSND